MTGDVCLCNGGTYFNTSQGTCVTLPANSVRDSNDHSKFICNNGYYYSSVAAIKPPEQYASTVIAFSSQWSTGSWNAAQVIGQPNTFSYGDISTAWAPLRVNGNGGSAADEFITVGFTTPVYARAVEIRETCGNGFVRSIELLDQSGTFTTIWSGVDTSQPGSPVDFRVDFDQTNYLVVGVRINTDIDHNSGTWEEIDSIKLIGTTGTEVVVVEESCLPCFGLCTTCTSATSCSTCKGNSALPQEGGVCKCNNSYKYNANASSCEICPSNSVQDPNNAAVCACGSGYSIQSGTCQCNSGTYFKTSTSSCVALPNNSTRDANNHSTFTCNTGYYYSSATDNCPTCPALCTACSNANYCTSCVADTNYDYWAGTCFY